MVTQYAPPLSSPHGHVVSEMTYTVSSGTLNSSIPYHTPMGTPAPHAPPHRRNVVVFSHAEYVPTLTAAPPYALRPRWVKRPGDLDLLTLKVVSESRVTWATSVPILVFLGLSVLDLGPMYATDRRQTKASLNAPAYYGAGA